MAEQSNYDKEVIALNERVQIFNEFFSGQLMRIVPVKNDPNHRWNSWLDEKFEPDMESQQIMGPYFAEILEAQKSGSWQQADIELKNSLTISRNGGKMWYRQNPRWIWKFS